MAQSIREMLDSREKEVRRLIEDIRTKHLAPLERDLSEIIIARAAIQGRVTNADLFAAPSTEEGSRYMRMTYAELAQRAFVDEFETGATIGELIAFIRNKYGREISQGSFSPVLSRMKASGQLDKDGMVWMPKFKRMPNE
ncbi:MAG: hypothetical protein AABY88_00475 [Pseudomonadota bacterium]|mgnify:CR=1 FL=1